MSGVGCRRKLRDWSRSALPLMAGTIKENRTTRTTCPLTLMTSSLGADSPCRWETTSSVFSTSTFEAPNLEVSIEEHCQRPPKHELICPQLLGVGKTIPRVRRTRQVPWGPAAREPPAAGRLSEPQADEAIARRIMARQRRPPKRKDPKRRFRDQVARLVAAAAPIQVTSIPLSVRTPEPMAPSWARPRSQKSQQENGSETAKASAAQSQTSRQERRSDTPKIPLERRSETPRIGHERGSETSRLPSERRCETPGIPQERRSVTPSILQERRSATPSILQERQSETPRIPQERRSETPRIPQERRSVTPSVGQERRSETPRIPSRLSMTPRTPLLEGAENYLRIESRCETPALPVLEAQVEA